jgi:hypothetical protein
MIKVTLVDKVTACYYLYLCMTFLMDDALWLGWGVFEAGEGASWSLFAY